MRTEDIKTRLRNTYDQLAKDWGKDPGRHDWSVEKVGEFAGKVKKMGGEKVLDLGCGSGVHSRHLIDQGLKVVGLDLSPRMIEEAKKRVPGGEFVVGDMMALDFPQESFDGVYARASLLHVPKSELHEVLVSVHSILKKKGILYVAVKEGEDEREVYEERYGQPIRRFYSFFKEGEMRNFLESARFKVEKNVGRFSRNSTTWLLFFASKS